MEHSIAEGWPSILRAYLHYLMRLHVDAAFIVRNHYIPESGFDILNVAIIPPKEYGCRDAIRQLWTNISFKFLKEKLAADYGTNLCVIVDDVLLFEFALRPTFADFGGAGAPGIYISRGYLSLARYVADLTTTYNIKRGMPMRVSLVAQARKSSDLGGNS